MMRAGLAGTRGRSANNLTLGRNPLRANLFAHYSLEEQGVWHESLSGAARALTPTNAPTSGQGKIGSGLVLASASTPDVRRADEPAFRFGDIAWAAAAWVKMTTKAATQSFFGKSLSAGNQREWQAAYIQASDQFAALVSGNGSSNTQVLASSFGSPPLGIWHLVYMQHDPAADLIGISINGGPLDTGAHSTGVFGGTAAFCIGSANGASPADAAIDEVVLWNRVLTARERLALYNSGPGVPWNAYRL